MKTKDLIKQLQKADPSGELHVRMSNGGMPDFVRVLPGYYDGGYWYIDDAGIMTYTTVGDKVEIYARSYDHVVEECDGDMEKIKTRVAVNVSNKVRHKEQTKEFWEMIEREAADHIRIVKEIEEKYGKKDSSK